jgi:hypothetical protein
MFAETRVFFSWLNWSDSNISYIFKIVGRYWQDDNFSCPVGHFLCRGTTCASFSLFGNWLCFIVLFEGVVMFVEYRCTSFEKFIGYLVNTSSFLLNFFHQFCYTLCVCWYEIKINGVFLRIFSDTVYARVVVFIRNNSFTNIICNICKKELKVSHISI